jgi:hypothetical protein
VNTRMRTAVAWDLGPTESAGERADRETRISDFLVFAALPLSAQSLPGLDVPVNEVAALVLVVLCVFRHPRAEPRTPTWLPIGLAVLVALLALSAQLNGVDGTRRLAHVVLYAGLALGLASGRVSLLSAARGLAVSLCAAVTYGALTIGSSEYPGRLTGVLGDPNVAAFLLVTLGAVSVPHVRQTWLRRLMLLTIAGGVLLTFSRTGLLALAFGGLWLLVGRRLRLLGGGLLVAALVWAVDHVPDDLRLLGPFSDRTGSDALRERLVVAEREILDGAPWYGTGPGTAEVSFGDQSFFFHSSYLAARTEGGWPVLVLVLAVLAACFVLLSDGAKRGRPECAWTQAGITGVLVMGVSLGEVLLDLPAAAVIGFAVATVLRPAGEPDREGAG